jgi:hypothetical protein
MYKKEHIFHESVVINHITLTTFWYILTIGTHDFNFKAERNVSDYLVPRLHLINMLRIGAALTVLSLLTCRGENGSNLYTYQILGHCVAAVRFID